MSHHTPLTPAVPATWRETAARLRLDPTLHDTFWLVLRQQQTIRPWFDPLAAYRAMAAELAAGHAGSVAQRTPSLGTYLDYLGRRGLFRATPTEVGA